MHLYSNSTVNNLLLNVQRMTVCIKHSHIMEWELIVASYLGMRIACLELLLNVTMFLRAS